MQPPAGIVATRLRHRIGKTRRLREHCRKAEAPRRLARGRDSIEAFEARSRLAPRAVAPYLLASRSRWLAGPGDLHDRLSLHFALAHRGPRAASSSRPSSARG